MGRLQQCVSCPPDGAQRDRGCERMPLPRMPFCAQLAAEVAAVEARDPPGGNKRPRRCASKRQQAPDPPARSSAPVRPVSSPRNPPVKDPPRRVDERCGPQELVLAPPVGQAGGGAAEAEDALVAAVQLRALPRRLTPLLAAGGRRGPVLEPRLNGPEGWRERGKQKGYEKRK